MDFGLEGKRALVIGASSGLRHAIAEALKGGDATANAVAITAAGRVASKSCASVKNGNA